MGNENGTINEDILTKYNELDGVAEEINIIISSTGYGYGYGKKKMRMLGIKRGTRRNSPQERNGKKKRKSKHSPQRSGKAIRRDGRKKRAKSKTRGKKRNSKTSLRKKYKDERKEDKMSRTPPAYDEEEIKNEYLATVNLTSLPSSEAFEQLYDIYYVVENGLEICVDNTLSSTDF